ncbi:MAG TPA: DUF4112 domain-containing protein [Thermoanaerobaculia bacterium]|nr:DUF4112 domain-containing protein [Thermoanaerobaculia bacterium]
MPTPISAEIYEPDESLPRDLVALRQFGRLMDDAFQIPGTTKRVGLDATVGLIPGVGDVITALLSSWILVGALRYRVPPLTIMRMMANIVLDIVIGLIPIGGDLFDLFFKQNKKNVELVIRTRNRARPPRSYRSIAFAFSLLLLFLVFLCLGLIVFLIAGLIRFAGTL